MSVSVFRRTLSGDAAKDHKVRNSVTAQPVGTMDADRHLTGHKQAGDRGAVRLQHFGGGVDDHAAEWVMDACRHLDGIVGTMVQRAAPFTSTVPNLW